MVCLVTSLLFATFDIMQSTTSSNIKCALVSAEKSASIIQTHWRQNRTARRLCHGFIVTHCCPRHVECKPPRLSCSWYGHSSYWCSAKNRKVKIQQPVSSSRFYVNCSGNSWSCQRISAGLFQAPRRLTSHAHSRWWRSASVSLYNVAMPYVMCHQNCSVSLTMMLPFCSINNRKVNDTEINTRRDKHAIYLTVTDMLFTLPDNSFHYW